MRFTTLFLSMMVTVLPTAAPGHHSVAAIYDTTAVVEAEGRIIHHEDDGLSLTIDRDRLDKTKAIEALENALGELKG